MKGRKKKTRRERWGHNGAYLMVRFGNMERSTYGPPSFYHWSRRTNRKVRRQLQGFLPREGWPEPVRRAFTGHKAPPNLEVSAKDGRIRLRFHIHVNGWKDAERLMRQFAMAKNLAKVADIPVMVGEQRAIVYEDRKPRVIEADFTQSEMRVLAHLRCQEIGRSIRARCPG